MECSCAVESISSVGADAPTVDGGVVDSPLFVFVIIATFGVMTFVCNFPVAFFFWKEEGDLPKNIGFPSTSSCFGFEDLFLDKGFVGFFFWDEEFFCLKTLGFPRLF